MGRPSKSTTVLTSEKRSHRTKAEINARENAENNLVSGAKLKERPEVKESEIAHSEFQRVNKLLKKIGKNDALYEPIINRYCMLHAECADFEKKRELFSCNLDELSRNTEMDASVKYRLETEMQKSILSVDKQLQAKRRMMFDIEKECAMTISAAMRSIPKTPAAKKNPLEEVLMGNV